MRNLALAAVMLAGVACGPAKPGPQPNVTYFWRVVSSAVEFNDNCSDEPMFRMANGPLQFEQNSYIVYRGSSDGTKAVLMSCTMLDAATCMPASSNVIFDVAGAEMSFATELKTRIGTMGTCNVLDTQTWLLTDNVSTLDVAISDTLSLVDDPATCDMIEAQAKAESTNMKGFQGCTITFKIGASAR
jgi:hypothetical protein